MYDNEKEVQAQNDADQKKLLARKKALVKDYKRTFNSEYGMRVLHDLIANNFIMQPTFRRDPNVMMIQEGQRICVLNILAIMEINPSDLESAIREINARVKKEAAKTAKEKSNAP